MVRPNHHKDNGHRRHRRKRRSYLSLPAQNCPREYTHPTVRVIGPCEQPYAGSCNFSIEWPPQTAPERTRISLTEYRVRRATAVETSPVVDIEGAERERSTSPALSLFDLGEFSEVSESTRVAESPDIDSEVEESLLSRLPIDGRLPLERERAPTPTFDIDPQLATPEKEERVLQLSERRPKVSEIDRTALSPKSNRLLGEQKQLWSRQRKARQAANRRGPRRAHKAMLKQATEAMAERRAVRDDQ